MKKVKQGDHVTIEYEGMLEGGEIVENPERAALGCEHEILPVHSQVGDRGYRQVQLQRLPVGSVVE